MLQTFLLIKLWRRVNKHAGKLIFFIVHPSVKGLLSSHVKEVSQVISAGEYSVIVCRKMYSSYTFYCYLLQGVYAVLWCIVYVKKEDLGRGRGWLLSQCIFRCNLLKNCCTQKPRGRANSCVELKLIDLCDHRSAPTAAAKPSGYLMQCTITHCAHHSNKHISAAGAWTPSLSLSYVRFRLKNVQFKRASLHKRCEPWAPF